MKMKRQKKTINKMGQKKPNIVETKKTEIKTQLSSEQQKQEDEFEEIETTVMEEYETEEEVEKTINEDVEISEEEEKEIIYNAEEFKDSKWYFSNEEKSKYKSYFTTADTNQDGVIQPKEAFDYFMKSQLDKKVLGKVWNIVEQNKEGTGLTENGFFGMFHIVFKLLKYNGKLECPDVLPPCLRSDVMDKIGTPVIIKTKVKKMVATPKTIKEKIKIKKQKPAKKIIKQKKLPTNDNSNQNKNVNDEWDNFGDFNF